MNPNCPFPKVTEEGSGRPTTPVFCEGMNTDGFKSISFLLESSVPITQMVLTQFFWFCVWKWSNQAVIEAQSFSLNSVRQRTSISPDVIWVAACCLLAAFNKPRSVDKLKSCLHKLAYSVKRGATKQWYNTWTTTHERKHSRNIQQIGRLNQTLGCGIQSSVSNPVPLCGLRPGSAWVV